MRVTWAAIFLMAMATGGSLLAGGSALAADAPPAESATATPEAIPEATPEATSEATSEATELSAEERRENAQESNPRLQRPIELPELPADVKNSPPIAYILRVKSSAPRIQELSIVGSTSAVLLVATEQDIKPTITVRGQYRRPGWRIFVQGEKEPLKDQFVIYAHLRGRVSEITFNAVGPNNQVQTEKVYVYAPTAKSFHVVSAWEGLLFSAGFGFLTYTQSSFGTYQSISATGSVRYSTPQTDALYGLLANADMTVVSFYSSPVNTAPQVFEGKLDLTIRVGKADLNRLRHRILMGVSYLTMFSNGSPFGFKDLATPEVGWQTRYVADYRDDWIGELRYMPVGGVSQLGQQGITVGLMRSRLLANARRVEAGLGFTAYNYSPSETNAIQLAVYSARLGLTF